MWRSRETNPCHPPLRLTMIGLGLLWKICFKKTFIFLCHWTLPGLHPKLSRAVAWACIACSFSILLNIVKLSCKSKIKGLDVSHKTLTLDMFSVVCNSEGEKKLLALSFFINLLMVFYHFLTFLYKNHSATFTNYKISFMCRIQLMVQLNLVSRKIRCFFIPRVRIYYAACLCEEVEQKPFLVRMFFLLNWSFQGSMINWPAAGEFGKGLLCSDKTGLNGSGMCLLFIDMEYAAYKQGNWR